MKLARLRLIFHFSFAVLIPCLSANIAEVDERQQDEKAMDTTIEAYDHNPQAIINDFNLY
ncbi:hypothetical protein WN944_005480 [Citrus x changshan-huyou]|uniref:Pectate lyase N-terminal domain-containing protein n=1 Tax=Citrus x changshan-huyou TaxID=2935761 RepID=A0AAP0QJN5_9ROSI